MEELWSSQCLFYSMTDTYSNFAQLRFRMDAEIDRPVLQRALDTAIGLYPYFRVKLARRGEELVLEENDAPFSVYGDADAPTLEPGRNNGYLLRVSAAGSVINISFCHAITDGRGILPFIRTLLHYYWLYLTDTDSGAAGLRLAGSEIPAAEFRDPLLDYKPDGEAFSLPPRTEGVFRLPVESDPQGNKYVFQFSMSTDSLMKYARMIDGSPNAVMALFMSRAVHRIHPQAGNIVAGVAADFRHACNQTDSHYCRIGLLSLPYYPKMDSMDISTCATCFRGSIILQSDDAAVQANLAATQQFCAYVKSLKTLEEKCRISESAVERGSSGATFTVSYTGKQDFGAIDSHIRFIGIIADTQVIHMCVEILSVKDRFFITVTQDFPADVYVREMMKELGAEGVDCIGYRTETVPYEHGPSAMRI